METPQQNYFVETTSTKEKYVKVMSNQNEPKTGNEIRISNDGAPNKYFAYGALLFLDKNYEKIILKSYGKAISKGFLIAELIRRRIPGLHQINEVKTVKQVDTFEPLEEGLDTVTVEKSVISTEIILSKKKLKADSYGYQPPLPLSNVKELFSSNTNSGGGWQSKHSGNHHNRYHRGKRNQNNNQSNY